MTRHARVGAGQSGKRRFFDRSVTITAVDPVIANVMFVTEWHWLIQRNIDIGGIRRPINFGSRPARGANKGDGAENDHPGMSIRARRKELGHDELCFYLAKRNRA